MSNANKITANTAIYDQIEKIAMTESVREEAIYALRLGETIASTILWAYDSVEHVFASAAPKPGFRHNVTA